MTDRLREAAMKAVLALAHACEQSPGLYDDAYNALSAALAEPVPEPVAWLTPGQDLHLHNDEGFRFSDWTPLYRARETK